MEARYDSQFRMKTDLQRPYFFNWDYASKVKTVKTFRASTEGGNKAI